MPCLWEGDEGMTYASRGIFFATASRCVISWSRTWPVEFGSATGGFFTEISLD